MVYKKVFLIIALLSLTTIGAAPKNPVELTVVNKSGMEIAVGLVEANSYRAYYLHVDEGTKSLPKKEVFAIERAQYTMTVYYIEIYDPVYGTVCDDPSSNTWDAIRNFRITVPPCNNAAKNSGELTQMKSSSKQGQPRSWDPLH